MTSYCTLVFLALIASVAAQAPAAGGRPSLDEYKAQQAEEAAAEEEATAKDAKMAAVKKVIFMLEGLRTEVLADGEQEAHLYNTFSCFCKDETAAKTASIAKGEDDKETLITSINSLKTEREELDTQIKTLLEEIEKTEKAMKEKTKERKKTLAVYEANEADLAGAVQSLESAIEVLKASKTPSFAQMQNVAQTVRSAITLADALGLGGASTQKAVSMLLQQAPDVPMQNYDFHSDGIIETLEKLLVDFRNEKNEVDAAEVESVKVYESYMQEKTDYLKAKNKELDQAKKERDEKIEEIESNNQELSTVSATLLDDQEYLAELTTTCTDKAKTYDQRTQVRSDELAALTTAIEIIKGTVSEKTTGSTVRLVQQGLSVRMVEAMARDEGTMEGLEADAEADEDAPSFFQLPQSGKAFLSVVAKKSQPEGAKEAVVDLLRNEGVKMNSAVLTALASQISADPFAKIKILIQELIERLLKEAANEANQKGWCDKAISDAEQKRDFAADEIRELNSNMAVLEARIDKLTEALSELKKEIAGIKAAQMQATLAREAEKAENEQIVTEAKAGLEAVAQAIDILDKFYKTAAKAEVSTAPAPAAFIQTALVAQAPAVATPMPKATVDAPDTGFDSFEAYTGKQGSAPGVIGMLEVIESDFERTISETEKAEAQAQKDYMEFMTKSGMSLAQKEEAQKEQQRQLDDADEKLANDQESLDSETEILQTAISELLELKPACVDTGMSYAERVARREEEIAALNKALCILQKYEQFGPDGVGGC